MPRIIVGLVEGVNDPDDKIFFLFTLSDFFDFELDTFEVVLETVSLK